MIPGVNPAQAKQLMKKMGISQQDMEVLRLEMILPDKKLIFESPDVAMVTMQGQQTFQVSGSFSEHELSNDVTINEEDVATVQEQTQCSKEQAEEALQKHDGDIAAAIMELSE